MATAAKAKLLLRELKTVKADLAFAKERCSQLEEENKRHRENRDKGNHRADDDLVCLLLFLSVFIVLCVKVPNAGYCILCFFVFHVVYNFC